LFSTSAVCDLRLDFGVSETEKLRQHGDARGGKALDAGGVIGGA